jgi:hypothetical protein
VPSAKRSLTIETMVVKDGFAPIASVIDFYFWRHLAKLAGKPTGRSAIMSTLVGLTDPLQSTAGATTHITWRSPRGSQRGCGGPVAGRLGYPR